MKTAVFPNLEGPVEDISLQSASVDIWDKKYRLKTKSGDALDQDIDDTYQRIAKALAETETPENSGMVRSVFGGALRNGAIPAGGWSTWSGATGLSPKAIRPTKTARLRAGVSVDPGAPTVEFDHGVDV